MENTKTESIQCPTFSGESKDFSIWSTRFQAFALVKQFDTVLMSGSTRLLAMPTTHAIGKALDQASTDDTVVASRQAMRENDLAMAF